MAKKELELSDLWSRTDKHEPECCPEGPEDMGIDLVNASRNIGTATAIGFSVGDGDNCTVGRMAFSTCNGNFVVSLPSELVALIAANVDTMVLRTSN